MKPKLWASALAALTAGCASSGSVETAPAPTQRPSVEASTPASFMQWRDRFRPKALASGVSAAVFDAAFAGVVVNARVLELDSRQPEFTRAIWEYLDSAVSDSRVENGRRLAAEKAAALARLEDAYGVDSQTLLAIWGIESAYGANYGSIPVIESLSTLAYEGRRCSFGEEQLLAALRILEAGDVEPGRMVGSWAGAMGHTQFIPTSFLEYAVDATGDGRRDLWADDAIDALGSTANYLARFGWTRGAPWGEEVRLPAGFDYGFADGRRLSAAEWRALGVAPLAGGGLADHGPAELLLPAGARGPAFLAYPNFRVIKRYNNATSYAMAVGHLGDRIAGGAPFSGAWPRDDRPLSRTERKEMQERLTALGFDTQGSDGIVGPNTRAAIRGFQRREGRPVDGYASADLLAAIRRATDG